MSKILFISHSSQIGGAENVLFQLVSRLPKEEFECFCIFPEKGPLKDKIDAIGVKTFIINLKWWVVPGNNYSIPKFFEYFCGLKRRVAEITEIIKNNKIDLIFSNTIVIGDGAIAAKVNKIPHIWHVHEILSKNPDMHTFINLKSFYSLVNQMSDYVVVVSKAVKDELERYAELNNSKIKIIYNGIEINSMRKAKSIYGSEESLVFSAGIVSPRKNFLLLLHAAKYVHKEFPKVKFKIAGNTECDKNHYKSLLKERKRLGLHNETFEFIGFQKNLASYFNKCKIFVLPSISDPFALVIGEAMSTGIPVITTDCGGPAEIVVDNVTGFIVPVNDAKYLADRIIFLLKNPDTALEMGKAGFERVQKHFSSKKFLNNFTKFLREINTESKIRTDIDFNTLIEILDSFGENRKKTKTVFDFYKKINNSFPMKVYKRLPMLKRTIRKLVDVG